MRTLIFSVHLPKNMSQGHVRKALDTVFNVPLKATKQKIKDITSHMYAKRAKVESMGEEVTRLAEEQEKVNQNKKMFREIERVRDLEFA